VVVGAAGEEIFTDKYGRVKVQFHWDREGRHDADSSCWIRVGTTWAGKGWGALHIPRIGQEVIVAFEEGDPDRPIIVGSVYNAAQMPPVALPGGKSTSSVKSNSTPGGGGFNEMSLDDTKGKERITIHGQYDMSTTVLHDHSMTVHNNRSINVDGTHTETIKKATAITIIEGNYSHDVAKGAASYHVKDTVSEEYENGQSTTVQKGISISCTDSFIQIYANNQMVLISDKEITIQTGASSLYMKADGTIELSGKSVTISGTSEINLGAPKIEVAGDNEVVVGVSGQSIKCDPASVTVSGAAITASAQGVHQITGSLVKIN